jgi:hypothetical protein
VTVPSSGRAEVTDDFKAAPLLASAEDDPMGLCNCMGPLMWKQGQNVRGRPEDVELLALKVEEEAKR